MQENKNKWKEVQNIIKFVFYLVIVRNLSYKHDFDQKNHDSRLILSYFI